MCLAEAGASVNEKRVVGPRGELGYGLRSGRSELVAGADHEVLESIPWIEL